MWYTMDSCYSRAGCQEKVLLPFLKNIYNLYLKKFLLDCTKQ